jgi:hypothetical protein
MFTITLVLSAINGLIWGNLLVKCFTFEEKIIE